METVLCMLQYWELFLFLDYCVRMNGLIRIIRAHSASGIELHNNFVSCYVKRIYVPQVRNYDAFLKRGVQFLRIWDLLDFFFSRMTR